MGGERGAKLGLPPLVAPLAQSTVYTSVQSTAYSLNNCLQSTVYTSVQSTVLYNSALCNLHSTVHKAALSAIYSLHIGALYSLYNSAVYNLHSTVYKAALSTIYSLHIGLV